MISEIDTLIQNLRSSQIEIRLLALDTLSRYQFGSEFNPDILFSMQEIILNYGRIKDTEFKRLSTAAIANIKQQLIAQTRTSDEENSSIDLDDLLSPNSNIRRNCLIQIMNHNHIIAHDSILRMLINEQNKQILALSIKVLSAISKPKIVKLFQVFAYHPESIVRQNAISAILNLGDYRDIIDLLLPVVNLSDSAEVDQIAEILTKFESQAIISHLKLKLQDQSEHRRLLAVLALGKLSGTGIIELINISTNDRSPKIRIEAIKALLSRPDIKLITHTLNRLVQDTDIEVSETAMKNLQTLSNEIKINRITLSNSVKPATVKEGDVSNKKGREIPIENTSEPPLADSSSIDDQIDLEFLNLGRNFFQKIKVIEFDYSSLKTNLQHVEKARVKIEQLEQNTRDQNLVQSITKVIGGNINEKLAVKNAKLELEEAYIDLGENVFGLMRSENLSFSGVESSLNRLNKLFKLRKEFSRTNP